MAGINDIPFYGAYVERTRQNQQDNERGETQALQQFGALSQLQAQMQTQQKAREAAQREQAMRQEVAALGPNPDQAALVGVMSKYAAPDDVLKVHQGSLDRQLQRDALAAAAKERVDGQKELQAERLRQDLQMGTAKLEQDAKFQTQMHEWRLANSKTDADRLAETTRHNKSMEGIQGQLAALRGEAIADKRDKSTEAKEKKEQRDIGIIDQANSVIQEITDAKGLVSNRTTGWGGLLANLPKTDARNLQAKLTSIKANLGFDRLQQMRQDSPTGGALGQVAVQELVALQSTVASLDQLQEAGQISAALEKIETHYANWRDTVIKSRGGTPPPRPTQPATAPQPTAPSIPALPPGFRLRPQ